MKTLFLDSSSSLTKVLRKSYESLTKVLRKSYSYVLLNILYLVSCLVLRKSYSYVLLNILSYSMSHLSIYVVYFLDSPTMFIHLCYESL